MSLRKILRAITRRWYLSIPGTVLALVLGGIIYNLVPAQYTSTGIAVLVQPKVLTGDRKNPLMSGGGSLNTETLTIVQALDAPGAGAGLGVVPGQDSFTVKNVGNSTLDAGSDHPFLYISSQSNNPVTASSIIAEVVTVARQELADEQAANHVVRPDRIQLQIVVPATEPQQVMIKKYTFAGAATALALLVVAGAACGFDLFAARRTRARRRRFPDVVPVLEPGHGHPAGSFPIRVKSSRGGRMG